MFTYAMLAVFLAFFAAEYSRSDLADFYAFPWRIADGEVWRLITCTFLHASVIHIAFNAAMFFRFSRVVDDWLGPWGAMALYAFFAVGSSAAQLLVSKGGMVGASGVVYGLFGFLWVMSRRRDDAALAADPAVVQTMLGWLLVCFVVNQLGGNIGNTAHAVGLALGWLTGQTVVARKTWRVPLALATLAACALPIVFCQRAVWEKTLAHVPPFNRYYWLDLPDEYRIRAEHPDEPQVPGLF